MASQSDFELVQAAVQGDLTKSPCAICEHLRKCKNNQDLQLPMLVRTV